MKPLISICFALIAASLLPLNAAEQEKLTIKSSSADDFNVKLQGEIAGKPHSFDCFKNVPSCSLLEPGEYLMVEADANEGVYNDCTNVVLYKASSGATERVGIYCWETSGDSYPTTVYVETISSTVPDEIVEAAAANGSQLVEVRGPTIIAFFPPVSDAELSKNPDTNESLSDFQVYAAQVREPLQQKGINFKVVYAHQFTIRLGKAVTVVTPKKAQVGYYFFTSRKKPKIEYGVMTDVDLLHLADEYFGKFHQSQH